MISHVAPQYAANKTDRCRTWQFLSFVLLLVTLVNVRWIWLFRRNQPYDIDEAAYLRISIENFYALMHGGLLNWIESVLRPSKEAPLTTALASWVYVFTEPIPLFAFLVPVAAGLVVIVATYHLGKTVHNHRLAALGAMLVATSPIIVNYSRTFHFALPATAITTLALLALARSRALVGLWWSVLFGACLGLMPLTRTMAIAFVPALLVAAAIQVVAESKDRRRRLLHFTIALVVAVVVGGVWLVPNGARVFDYLFTFGYGRMATAYGNEQSLLDIGTWIDALRNLAAYVYFPQLTFILLGLSAILIGATRVLAEHGPMLTVKRAVKNRMFPAIVLIAGGFTALASSPNKGSAFVAPLVPALLLASTWGMIRIRSGKIWQASIVSIVAVVAFISGLALLDLRLPVARPNWVWLPLLGNVYTMDGRGTIQKYEHYGGYSTDNPAIPISDSVGREWQRISETTARKLVAHGAQATLTLFASRDRLYNVNTVNLAQVLAGGQHLRLLQISTYTMSDSLGDYAGWLTTSPGARGCLLVTVDGREGEFPPTVDDAKMALAAREVGFAPVDNWNLPDNKVVTLWRRQSRACDVTTDPSKSR